MGEKNIKTGILLCIVSLYLTGIVSGRTIYVDANAPGPIHDGLSWASAYNYLQDALADATSSGDVNEIWVAEGIYRPDQSCAYPEGTGNRKATFQLKHGLVIRGGYAGFGEPDPNAHDIDRYETVLSGDLNADDGAVFANNGENSFHVLKIGGTGTTAVLYGLTIASGNANSPIDPDRYYPDYLGGGIFNLLASPVLIKCIFRDNWGRYAGGGVSNVKGSTTLVDCKFSQNYSSRGGAISNWRNRSVAVNCNFSGNSAQVGGAIRNVTSQHTHNNCVFSGNVADGGGAIYHARESAITLANCTFGTNVAPNGRAIACDSYHNNVRITNSIIWDGPSEITHGRYTKVRISYSDVQGGWAGQGNIDIDPCFVAPGQWVNAKDPNIIVEPNDPNAFWIDGDYHLLPYSPCIDAGDNNSVPNDTHDLDGDGDTNEPIPFDLDGEPRTTDGDNDGNLIVDMGAYEFSMFPLEVWMKFTPQSLNPASKGKWVKAHFVLPEGYSVEDVDANTPCKITEPFEPDIESDYMNVFINDEGLVEIEAAFERRAFCQAGIGSEVVEVRVEGKFISGQGFFGTDIIRVIDNTFRDLGIMASHWLEGGCSQPDWCHGSDINQDSMIDLADFALIDGCCIEVVGE